jgi:polysaccharide pyruvyl transferase WcaK-like protein
MVHFLRIIVRFFALIFRPLNRKWREGEPIRCLVVGYGGANNTGAEARTIEAIKQMLEADHRIHVTLTSLDREQTLRYITEHDRLKVAQINPVFIGCVLRLVLRSDMVVLGEGSCFKDNFSSALLWYFMYAAELAQRFNKPTVAYAVDAGRMKRANEAWARIIANKMDLLMTRTQAAADQLEEIGVKNDIKVTTDTAFTQHAASQSWIDQCLHSNGIDPRWPIVGLAFEELFWWPVVVDLFKAIRRAKDDHYKSVYYHSWPNDGKMRSEDMKRAIASYADWVSEEQGAQIVFFAMERLDTEPCRQVQSMMKSRSVLFGADNYNASEMTALLRRLSWLVTCRYHALVLSIGGGVPVIGLAHDERIESIMEELRLKDDYFMNYIESDILGKLKDKTHRLVSNKENISRGILEANPGYIARMAKNLDFFKDLVALRFGSPL